MAQHCNNRVFVLNGFMTNCLTRVEQRNQMTFTFTQDIMTLAGMTEMKRFFTKGIFGLQYHRIQRDKNMQLIASSN